jgi:hypothetical protein
MAIRSDRDGVEPITTLAVKSRFSEWLPVRGFHTGQETKISTNGPKIRLQS